MKSHKELESHLDRYSGLILYMRDMDELAYGKLCAVSTSLPCVGSQLAHRWAPRLIFLPRANYTTPK